LQGEDLFDRVLMNLTFSMPRHPQCVCEELAFGSRKVDMFGKELNIGQPMEC